MEHKKAEVVATVIVEEPGIAVGRTDEIGVTSEVRGDKGVLNVGAGSRAKETLRERM